MRQNRRYPSIATARIPAVSGSEAFLKDISITGCCIEYTMLVDLPEHSEQTITIYPEKESMIDKFHLLVESKWHHFDNSSNRFGLEIKKSPQKKEFISYVDYLAWRHNT